MKVLTTVTALKYAESVAKSIAFAASVETLAKLKNKKEEIL